jgi:hypothetical protein
MCIGGNNNRVLPLPPAPAAGPPATPIIDEQAQNIKDEQDRLRAIGDTEEPNVLTGSKAGSDKLGQKGSG